MRTSFRRSRASLLLLAALSCVVLLLSACGASQIETSHFNDPANFRIAPDASIEDTAENRELLSVVKAYRDAMVARNGEALRRMVSREYFENASTTDDRSDDYGNEKLDELFTYHLGEKVREVRYDMEIKQVTRENQMAHVDYEYYAGFRYVADGRDHWESTRDVNRLTLVVEDGTWKIAGGM